MLVCRIARNEKFHIDMVSKLSEFYCRYCRQSLLEQCYYKQKSTSFNIRMIGEGWEQASVDRLIHERCILSCKAEISRFNCTIELWTVCRIVKVSVYFLLQNLCLNRVKWKFWFNCNINAHSVLVYRACMMCKVKLYIVIEVLSYMATLLRQISMQTCWLYILSTIKNATNTNLFIFLNAISC